MNEIIVKSMEIGFQNKMLKEATVRMFKVGETVRKCSLTASVIIASVDASECYKEDGFSSVHEWAEKTFGFKKSQSYALLKIGQEYITEVRSKSGSVIGYRTNLLPEDSVLDFNTTQIQRMLPGGHELAVQLVENGEITPEMSAKKIADVVKSYTTEEHEEHEEQEEVETEPEESEVDHKPEERYVIVTDEIGNKYEIPYTILKEYIVK